MEGIDNDAATPLTDLGESRFDDSGYSSGSASRLHPKKLDFDHIDTLDTFTTDLTQALDGAFPRRTYPYTSVHCLLLSWEEDDLDVQVEITELHEVFESQFRFQTEEWKIPSRPNPTRALQDKLYAFQNSYQNEKQLLIVYYAGHGEADSRRGRSIWSANRHRDSPSLNWSSLQHLLETAIPHVLIILDCCFAANAARDTTEGTTKELLAACGRENPTLGVGVRSFTSALIEELKAFQSNPFTVAMLHSRLICMRWRLRYTPVLAMLSELRSESIHLAPLPIEETLPPPSPKLRVSADTRVLLAISVAQNAIPSVTDWIDWLNTDKAPAEILKIDARIESAYDSHSKLIIFSVPTLAWSRMADRDAYNFIGFVKSENLLKVSESQGFRAVKEQQWPPQARSYMGHVQYPSLYKPLTPAPSPGWSSHPAQGSASQAAMLLQREFQPPSLLHVEAAAPSNPNTKPEKLHLTYEEAKQIQKKGLALPQQDLLLRNLKHRNHIFLMDDSLSMEEHWDDALALFSFFAYFLKRLDSNGFEIYFTVSEDRKSFFNKSSALSHLKQMRLRASSNMSIRLGQILERYRKELERQKSRRNVVLTLLRISQPVKPLTIYIFTNAAWPRLDIVAPLEAMIEKLNQLALNKDQVGIQFINFGIDSTSIEMIKSELRAKHGADYDIIDIEPFFNGNILKMLLGAITTEFDGYE